jgi:lipoprotein-anchoring transpeptidase ErfK/SrfK
VRLSEAFSVRLLRRQAILLTVVAAAGIAQAVSAKSGAHRPAPPSAPPNDEVLRAQLFLDASAFKPGAIDGKWGEFMRKALVRYARSQGDETASFGNHAPAHFNLPLDPATPTLIAYEITAEDERWIGSVAKTHAAQTKQHGLPYQSYLELVAEKFHCRQDFLKQVNRGYDWTRAKPGDSVQVPNVASPFVIQEAMALKSQTEASERTNQVKTEKQRAPGEQYSIFVSVPERILELYQDGRLVGSYPITAGSKALPAPAGEWHVKGIVWMPTFRWDEAILHGTHRSGHFYQLPAGPNNPVGILWMGLNHKGSGIHGTDEPETIGRTTSHGCIRLSNWSAFDLGQKVLPGVHVTIH